MELQRKFLQIKLLDVNILSFLSVFYTSEVLVDIYVLARNDMRVASLIFCEMNFYVLKIIKCQIYIGSLLA